MSKVMWKPGTFINPVPAVMVTCGTMEKSNIVTVAWTGTINSDPAMCYISLRPTRYSYNLIKESGEFVIQEQLIGVDVEQELNLINLRK